MPGRKIVLAIAMVAVSFAVMADGADWSALTQRQQTALAPLAADWGHLPEFQRNKLLLVAERYDQLTPQQQRLLHARLRSWTHMTPEQRQTARNNYKSIQTLSKQDQANMKQQWLDSLCQEYGLPVSKESRSGR